MWASEMAESVGNRHPAVGSRAVITGIVPRYNFDELHYAFITTFQVLSQFTCFTGGWQQVMTVGSFQPPQPSAEAVGSFQPPSSAVPAVGSRYWQLYLSGTLSLLALLVQNDLRCCFKGVSV